MTSQRQQRLLCRAAFLLLCVAPTLSVGWWAIAVRLPSYRLEHQKAIASVTSLPCTVDRVTNTRPGVLLYEQLKLSDPESGQLLASLPFVEVESTGAATLIRLPHPATINGDRLDALWQLAFDKLRDSSQTRNVTFEANTLTLHLADGDRSLTDVRAHLTSEPNRSRMELTLRPALAKQTSGEGVRLLVVRNRTTHPASLSVELSTGESNLPVSLAAHWLPAAADFASATTWQGNLSLNQSGSSWVARASGQLIDLELDDLFRRRFAHHLAARARLNLGNLVVRNGQILSITGTLHSGPGQVSRTLLDAAQAHLGLGLDPVTPTVPVVAFGELGLEFAADGTGLTLRGACAKHDGTLLVGEQNTPFLREGRGGSQPVTNLLTALLGSEALVLPLAKDAQWLSALLPLPTQAKGPASGTLRARAVDVRGTEQR